MRLWVILTALAVLGCDVGNYNPGKWQAIGVPMAEVNYGNLEAVGAGTLQSTYLEKDLEVYSKAASGNAKIGGRPQTDCIPTGEPSSAIDWDARIQSNGGVNGKGSFVFRTASGNNWIGSDAQMAASYFESIRTESTSSTGHARTSMFDLPNGNVIMVAEYTGTNPDVISWWPRYWDYDNWTETDTRWSHSNSTLFTLSQSVIDGTPGSTGGRRASPKALRRTDTGEWIVALLDYPIAFGNTTCRLHVMVSGDEGSTWNEAGSPTLITADIDDDVFELAGFNWDGLSGNYVATITRDTGDGGTDQTIQRWVSTSNGSKFKLIQTLDDVNRTDAVVLNSCGTMVMMAMDQDNGSLEVWVGAANGSNLAEAGDSAEIAGGGGPTASLDGMGAGCTTRDGRMLFFYREDGSQNPLVVFEFNSGGARTKHEGFEYLPTYQIAAVSNGENGSYIKPQSAVEVGSSIVVAGQYVSVDEDILYAIGAVVFGARGDVSDDGLTSSVASNIEYRLYSDDGMIYTPTDLPDDGSTAYRYGDKSGTFTATPEIVDHGNNKVLRITATSAGSQVGTYQWTALSVAQNEIRAGLRLYGDTGGSITDSECALLVATGDVSNNYRSELRLDFANDQIRLFDVHGSSAVAAAQTSVGLQTTGIDVLVEQIDDAVTWLYRPVGSVAWTVVGTSSGLTAQASSATAFVRVGQHAAPTADTEFNMGFLKFGSNLASAKIYDGLTRPDDLIGIKTTATPQILQGGVSVHFRGGPAAVGDQWEINSWSRRGFVRVFDPINYASPRVGFHAGTQSAGTDWDGVFDCGTDYSVGANWDSGMLGNALGFVGLRMQECDGLNLYFSADGSTFPGTPTINLQNNEALTTWTQIGTNSFIGASSTPSRWFEEDELKDCIVRITDDGDANTVWARVLGNSEGQLTSTTNTSRMVIRTHPDESSGAYSNLGSGGSSGSIMIYHCDAFAWKFDKSLRLNRYLKIEASVHSWVTAPVVGMAIPLRMSILPRQHDVGAQEGINLRDEEIGLGGGLGSARREAPAVADIRLPFRQVKNFARQNQSNTSAVTSAGHSTTGYVAADATWEQVRWAVKTAGKIKPVVVGHSLDAPSGIGSLVTYLGQRAWMWAKLDNVSSTMGPVHGRLFESDRGSLRDFELIARQVT